LLITFIIFKSPPVQTLITRYVANKLAEKLNTRIEIGGVDFSVFKTIVLHNVYIEDQQKDTLFYIKHLNVNIKDLDLNQKIIKAQYVEIQQPQCFLKLNNQGVLNLQFFISALSGDTTDSTPTKPFRFFIGQLAIKNGKFKFDNVTKPYLEQQSVDFDHLNVTKLNLKINQIAVLNDSITFNIRSISLNEQSGFCLKKLNTRGYISDLGIHLKYLYLETNYSLIRAAFFNLKTRSLDDFNDFENRVKFDVSFYSSKIGSEDIAFFANNLHGLKQNIVLSGKVKGPLTSLKTKDFFIKYNKNTFIKGNYEITGLPDIDNIFMVLKFDFLKTKLSDFVGITLPPFDGSHKLKLPEFLNNLGSISYKGELSGFINDFVAYGKLRTDLGEIVSDANIHYDTLAKNTVLKGNVALNNFFIGKIIGASPLVKNISMNGSINAEFTPKGFNSKIEASFSAFNFNNYTYKGIKVNGVLNEKMFDGSFQLQDPNIGIDFLGKIDYSAKEPVFNFMADVKNAKLNVLNFLPKDSNIELSFLLDSKITGSNIDNANGQIDFYQLSYKHNQLYTYINNLKIDITQNDQLKEISLNSDVVDFNLNGFFKFEQLSYYVQMMINTYCPSIQWVQIPKSFKPNTKFNINTSLTLKQYADILKDYLPWLYLSDQSNVNISWRGRNDINIRVLADSANIAGIGISKFNLRLNNINEKLNTELQTSKLFLSNEIILNSPQLKIFTFNNENELYINWDRNDSLLGDGEISAIVNMNINNNKSYINLVFNPSRFNFNQQEFYINDGIIDITDSIIHINQTIINQGEQYLYVNGDVGSTLNDSLHININQFQISYINPFIRSTGLNFEGITNGDIYIKRTLNKPILVSNFNISKLKLNNEEIGELKIEGEWNDEKQILHYNASAYRGNINTLNVKGQYDKNGQIDANIQFQKWRLNVIEPFISSFASNVKGIISGNVHLAGSYEKPQLNGKLRLTKTAFSIAYLNARYNFTGDVEVNPTAFVVQGIDLYDEEGNVAKLSGSIKHQYFRNVKIDLLVNTKRFLFLNTRYTDNNMFYGAVYTSGLVNITGDVENIAINANVQTEKGTKFNLNLESGSELTQQNFIHFVNTKTINDKKQNNSSNNILSNSGLSLSFNIQATPEANFQLIFDSKVGDIIKTQGTGNIRLELKPNGDFYIFGDYIIAQGDYLFTLQNVINKKFEVKPGSIVSFSGDPLNADLDIKTVYKLRTSLYELMMDSTYKQRVPVECELSLTNKLLNPTFHFSINVPNSDSHVEGVLGSLSDEEINKQVISLLVLNRFVTPETYKSGVKTVEYSNTNALGVNSSELLTNQLNHWLSQISKTVNLGVNYRPGDMISNEELELALNTQIFNDRVTINTNLGVANSSQTESSMLIGDFDVELKVNKSGKLRAKGFNRTNTNILKDTSPYTQGVGLFYREEFDSWNDVLKNYWNAIFSRKKEQETKN